MSTYYRPSEPIAISEIEEKCKDDFKVLYRYEDQDGQWFRDNDGNFMHFALNEDKEVIDIFRYGGNDPECILDTLSNRFNVSIISEHDEDYEVYADQDTPVSTIEFSFNEDQT